ncbi:hypothetical protein D3C87_1505740 [compost metagenome]
MAECLVHHAHGLAVLSLIMQDSRKSRVNLRVRGIQQPSLIEATHRHAELIRLIKAVALLHPYPRRLGPRPIGLGHVGNPLIIGRFGGEPGAVNSPVHGKFVHASLRRYGRWRHAACKPQA